MSCCTHCIEAGDLFDRRTARHDVRRYRARGPSKTTRLLLDALLERRSSDRSVLDVGGGVGVIACELLRDGFSEAVQVDASAAYLEVAKEESARRGLRDRITYHFGDVVDLADGLPMTDVVTLDRVICCYPDVDRLVKASAGRARHLYGVVYPRERWITRFGTTVINATLRLRRKEFRTFIHSRERVEGVLRDMGFGRASSTQTFLWQVATYERVAEIQREHAETRSLKSETAR